MRIAEVVTVCALVLTSAASASVAQGYRGIVPLHSTCEDVKRILGVSSCKPPDNTYDLVDERVRITFSKRRCEKAWQKFWNVPPGTVLSVERFLKKPVRIDNLKLDLTKYEKMFTDSLNEVVYKNYNDGIEFRAVSESVVWFAYTPTPKDNHRLCRNKPESQLGKNQISLPRFWFDRYGDLPFSEEQKRLKNLAHELQEYPPTTQVWIVTYADLRAFKHRARTRAGRAKAYLVRTWAIAPSRIKTIDGGKHEKFEVVIYIVPVNSP